MPVLKTDTTEHPAPTLTTPSCIIAGCGRPQAVAWKKGLCASCHAKANKLVKSKQTTWEELAQRGLAIIASEDMSDPFTKAYNEKKV